MDHSHTHDGSPPVMGQGFWDERYRMGDRIWTGNPNPQLVAEVAGLTPSTALDVGCGEGADAIWLAEHGWTVTGVDISEVALSRARVQAAELLAEVTARLSWLHVDLTATDSFAGSYDLVSAQYMQLAAEPRDRLFGRLAAAVAPGGTLLIVGHHPEDMLSGARRAPWPELYYTATEVAAVLDPAAWTVRVDAVRTRDATAPDGRVLTIQDAVLMAERRVG